MDWFVQDSWKVTRRLTLEIGMRFASDQPWQLRDGEKGASFVLANYNPFQAPALFGPALDSTGKRVAKNPITGELMPVALIGAYVPGTGNPYNGMVAINDPSHPSGGYPNGWRYMKPPQLEPRFGFAYDPFGDGMTPIRGSFSDTKEGLFNSSYITGDTATSPPVVAIPTMYSGSLSTFRGATGYLFPPTFVPAWEQNYKPASAYNYAFNIQRNIGFSTAVSVGYVGNLGRHLLEVRNLNTLPYGAQFLPQSQDPTSPGQSLPNAFLVPLPGYSTVSLAQNSAVSSYNALQVTADRRLTRGLQFGVAYTFSKAMDLTDSTASVPQYQPNSWIWGKAGYDQRQVLVVNYIWDVPKGSKIWPSPFSRFVLDNWQLAGIATFASGSPLGVSYTTTDNANILGGGDGARINVIGDPNAGANLHSFSSWFNPTVFARPAKGDRGNAPKVVFVGPGINDWDLSLFKSFPILSERRIVQFRGEFYNAFNHTQYSGVNTTARFDPAGNQVNSQFGWITSTRTPRVVQLALTFRFY